MDGALGVRVLASPRLLQDVVVQTLFGQGIDMTESEDSLVSVVTADHIADVHSKIVIVLGETTTGDVYVVVDGARVEDRALDAADLRQLVLDLAERVTHDQPTTYARRTPMQPAAESNEAP